MPEIIERRHITGKVNFILKTAKKDISNYKNLILHLLSLLSNIHNLKTSVPILIFKQESNLLK